MLDFPGLSSAEVVAARRQMPRVTWAGLIARLQPEWLVLRPSEATGIAKDDPRLLAEHYRQAKVFDASQRLEAYRWVPGRGYLMFDRTFILFQRTELKTADRGKAERRRMKAEG